MIEQLAKGIVRKCSEKGYITEDTEIYIYGGELVISSLMAILLSLLLGYIVSNFKETFCYMGLFILLRRYTGGFHADTHIQCIFGTFLLSVILNLLLHIQIHNIVIIIFSWISAIIIILLCPIKNSRIQSTNSETHYIKVTCLFLIAIIFFINLSLYKYSSFSITLSFVLCSVSHLMVMEVIKNNEND